MLRYIIGEKFMQLFSRFRTVGVGVMNRNLDKIVFYLSKISYFRYMCIRGIYIFHLTFRQIFFYDRAIFCACDNAIS